MRVTFRVGKRAPGMCACALLLLAACSREQEDWRSAEAADTVESYDRFIQRHPESELTRQARMRVLQLAEERDWEAAASADTPQAYRHFIAQHPDGRRAQEGRIRLENFALTAQGQGGGNHDGGNDGQGGAADGQRGAGDRQAGADEALGGAGDARGGAGDARGGAGDAQGRPAPFAVQLGAFSTEAGASSQWRVLSARFAPELQGLTGRVVAVETADGRLYRLQAAVGGEGQARAVCDALRRQSQACVVVPPS